MIRFEQVAVATGHEEAGVLAFCADRLLGVLVKLADDNAVAPGCWYLEASFGPSTGEHPTFSDLDQAAASLACNTPNRPPPPFAVIHEKST